MSIIIALLPALLWGITPLWTHYLGGSPISQLLGTTYGALIVGLSVYLINRPAIDASTFWWCFLAGFMWSIGQLSAYVAYDKLGVATTAPISAGAQLIFVNIMGVLFFGSWITPVAKIIGFIAVVLIIAGVYLTTRGDDDNSNQVEKSPHFVKNIMILIFGAALGYGSCSVLPKIPNAAGWATFPPQAIGMFTSATIFALLFKQFRDQQPFFKRSTFKNIITGVSSNLGTFAYMFSILLNGVSTGFTLSQMATVVSTFGGLVILHETKHKKALFYTLTGCLLVVLGCVMTGFIR
ncbi:GRP family sugar transporter [Lactobacillaceae bacterium Scapto_B20]